MQPYLLSILSGLCIAAAFPDTDWNLLAWVGLLPFFMAVEGRGWRETFRIGYAGGVAFWWGLMYWLTNVTVAGFLVLTLYLALYFPLFGVLMNAAELAPGPLVARRPRPLDGPRYARTYAFTGLHGAFSG